MDDGNEFFEDMRVKVEEFIRELDFKREELNKYNEL